MSWYKKSKNLQEIMWDPIPNQKDDDYTNMYSKSDKNAILERMYSMAKDYEEENFNIGMLFNQALKYLSGLGGEVSMWNFFIEERDKNPNSEKGKYLDSLKKAIEKDFMNFYKKRIKQDNEAIANQPGPPQPPMG